MRLDKNQQKQLTNTIRSTAKKLKYQMTSNSVYRISGTAFIHCDFLVIGFEKMVYRIYIKEVEYDDIFWKIMKMESNLSAKLSLKATGAFKSPSILLNKGEIVLTDQFEAIAEKLFGMIEQAGNDFLKQYNVDEYVIQHEEGVNKDILQCLAYIHMNKKEAAWQVAHDAIASGNKGGFVNEGKTFFEWVEIMLG